MFGSSSVLTRLRAGVASSFWARVIVGAAILLIPAVINGFPFWFYDTIGYHQVGRSIVTNLVELFVPADAPAPISNDVSAQPAPADQNFSLTYIGGRSPTYGLFIFLANAIGSYWIVAIVQALVASWLLTTSLRVLARPDLRAFLLTIAAATALSSLPIFAAELMPDVQTGFAFIAITLLFVGGKTIGALERAALVLVIAAAAASHQTNLPLGFALIVLVLIAGWALRLPRRDMFQRAAIASVGLFLAMGVNAGYALATKALLGEAPGNPPYLMARVLVDGPGQLYLRDVCAPTPRFEICRYADRPFEDVNDFLWNPDPRKGVYALADIDSRHRLMAEERAFVVGAVTHYPIEQITASSSNAFRLLFSIGVAPELGLSRHAWDQLHFGDLAPNDDARARASLAFRDAFPFVAIDRLDGAVVLIALVFLAWRLTRPDIIAAFAAPGDVEANTRRALAAVAACLCVWLVADAVLCGTLSGVFDRYEARAIWLVPLLAMFTYLRVGPAFSVSRTSKAVAPQS